MKQKEGFKKLMDDVFNYVKPHATGLWLVSTFANGVEKYAKSKKVSLKAYWSEKTATYNNAIDYIKDGLRRDCPVALNVHANWKAKLVIGQRKCSMEYHWVVITKIEDKMVDGKRKVTLHVSSWGVKYTLDFYDVYYYSSYWALMYFTW